MSGLRPAVFIDRDGTVIEERVYLSDPDGVVLVPGALEALRTLRDAGFALVLVTNQAGISKGHYSVEDYHAVAKRLDDILGEAGTALDGTYVCPHHPETTGHCDCRKPGVGMYRQAAGELGLDFEESYFIGDKLTDVVPAIELGGRGILVRTGYGRELEGDAPEQIAVVDDLQAAAGLIVKSLGR